MLRKEFLPVDQAHGSLLLAAVENNFNRELAGGWYFDIDIKDGCYRLGILEEAGCCSVMDLRIDQIILPEDKAPAASLAGQPLLAKIAAWLYQE